ncbi:hypothetical protein RIF29_36528 [Crotalaria pallida]|uniref:R13L1/DRL21-like LRR repeat region domain-containing protein n=1 Tax=Crotalaria pallida TaxID=3830 RepID=A0AAN9ECC8_CROPI
MVMLWVAEGLITFDDDDDHDKVFDLLVSMQVILFSGIDRHADTLSLNTTRSLYKVNHSKIATTSSSSSTSAVAIEEEKYLIIWEGDNDPNMDHHHHHDIVVHPEKVHHLSIDSRSLLALSGFDFIEQFQRLHTLFLIHSPCFFANRVPYSLFLSLKHLLSLNLSDCSISELPDSISSLKSLIYIDLSSNPIKFLPEPITSLRNLQTLRLRNCSLLHQLPLSTNNLTSLRHLDLDVIGQLYCMPRRMGTLIHLQTLSAFLVSVMDDGCRIGELKNIKNLKGPFCISNLQCVLNSEEAEEVDLVDKKFITKLELSWTDIYFDDVSKTERILQHLQPPFGIDELMIHGYGGFKLPSWISDSSYAHLVAITLYGFVNCDCLPSIGQLPSLQSLRMIDMTKLQRIDDRFCRDDDGNEGQQSPPAFPSLKELTIDDMPALEEWTGARDGDFPCLNKLKVECCPKLISLSFLPYLSSLKDVEITHCPNISSLPDGEIATSLESLLIIDCPELKKNCHKGEGKDWGKIAHVPNIVIEDSFQQMFKVRVPYWRKKF